MVEIETMDVDIYNWMILDDSNSVYDIMYIWYVYIYIQCGRFWKFHGVTMPWCTQISWGELDGDENRSCRLGPCRSCRHLSWWCPSTERYLQQCPWGLGKIRSDRWFNNKKNETLAMTNGEVQKWQTDTKCIKMLGFGTKDSFLTKVQMVFVDCVVGPHEFGKWKKVR